MKPRAVTIPNGRVWLRLADSEWRDSLDPSHAQRRGGRWNPPGSFPTLYLNADIVTARLQIERLLAGSPVRMDDLDDGAYVLVAAVLPAGQAAADASSRVGLGALGLPATYPLDLKGREVPHRVCQEIGAQVHEVGLRGVWCRSACTPDGQGRELAWFPATPRSRARPVWDAPLPLGSWRDAASWSELGLREQKDPRPR